MEQSVFRKFLGSWGYILKCLQALLSFEEDLLVMFCPNMSIYAYLFPNRKGIISILL